MSYHVTVEQGGIVASTEDERHETSKKKNWIGRKGESNEMETMMNREKNRFASAVYRIWSRGRDGRQLDNKFYGNRRSREWGQFWHKTIY